MIHDLYHVGGPPSYEEVFNEVYDVKAVMREIIRTPVHEQPVMRRKLTDAEIKFKRLENKNR